MCKTIKITEKDNFIWRLLTIEQAKDFYKADIDSLYALYDDNTESLVHDIEEIDELALKGAEFGIEVGFVNYIELDKLENAIKHHDFSYQYSDDYRVYKRGHDSLKQIIKLKDCVSQEVYVNLWNKYAPNNLKFKK